MNHTLPNLAPIAPASSIARARGQARHRPTRRTHAALVLACISCTFIGCSSYSSLPDPIETPFTAVPITADSTGPEHVLLAQLPTPGWRFTLDAIREDLRRRCVFVTLRQPQTGVTYPETPVTQRLATSVPTRTPITVYTRVVPYEGRDSNPPHSVALRTQERNENQIEIRNEKPAEAIPVHK